MIEISPGLSLAVADCLDALRELDAESVDAVITDPPYGILFMGKAWDRPTIAHEVERRRALGREANGGDFGNAAQSAGIYDVSAKGNRAFQVWTERWALEAFRVLKPGGHLLSFASTRTYHRMASGVEDAGFEIRDTLAWMFGSGFPKSLDVARAIDKAQGVEGEWRQEDHASRAGGREASAAAKDGTLKIGQLNHRSDENPEGLRHVYEAASDDARRWDGWGTALKPAFEPIVVARKPFPSTVAANVLEHGVGAINVDGCRIEFRDAADEAESKDKNRHGDFGTPQGGNQVYGDYSMLDDRENYDAPGRWPANVLLDEEAGALLDEQSGELAAGNHPALRTGRGDEKVYGSGWSSGTQGERRPTETGGASRFFYCAKVSRAERNAGLDALLPCPVAPCTGCRYCEGKREAVEALDGKNPHPTVKPIALMRWLIRLVTPPGGLVVDPFTGSGSTGCAAALEGMRFLGIEREPEYAAVAEARIRFWAEHGEEALRVVADREASERVREAIAETGQLDLLGSA